MDYRTVIKGILAFTVAASAAAGCGNPEAVPKHTETEQRAIDSYNNMTPQQKIDFIQKGVMPKPAKDAMIKKIKEQNHLP